MSTGGWHRFSGRRKKKGGSNCKNLVKIIGEDNDMITDPDDDMLFKLEDKFELLDDPARTEVEGRMMYPDDPYHPREQGKVFNTPTHPTHPPLPPPPHDTCENYFQAHDNSFFPKYLSSST